VLSVVGDCKLATVSSTKKSPAQQAPAVRPGATTTSLITSNTRKIGRKYEIDLQKGPQGLGFSITTRDNPAGGNCPIYIKNILPTVSDFGYKNQLSNTYSYNLNKFPVKRAQP